MILAATVSIDLDLAAFSRFLKRNGLRHRISEAGESQQIWVGSEQEVRLVLDLLQQYQDGEFELAFPADQASAGPSLAQRLFNAFWFAPVTMTFVAITVIFFPVTSGIEIDGPGKWFRLMTFVPFDIVDGTMFFGGIATTLEAREYWRFFSPMFLHFGALHIVFNMLWFWDIGRRLEKVTGAGWLLMTILMTSASSNMLQFAVGRSVSFGGMSGVVYGLLGFALVWKKLVPAKDIGMPEAIYWFMLGFLAFGFTGFFDALGLGALANWAHLGGLVSGALLGLVAAMFQKVSSR